MSEDRAQKIGMESAAYFRAIERKCRATAANPKRWWFARWIAERRANQAARFAHRFESHLAGEQ